MALKLAKQYKKRNCGFLRPSMMKYALIEDLFALSHEAFLFYLIGIELVSYYFLCLQNIFFKYNLK